MRGPSGRALAGHPPNDRSRAARRLRRGREDKAEASERRRRRPVFPPRLLQSSGPSWPFCGGDRRRDAVHRADVLIPITLAVLLSFVLSPLVDFLRRSGLWPAPAVGLSVLVALGAIGLIGTLLANQAATLSADVPHYVEAIESKVARIQVLAITRVASFTRLVSGAAPAAAPVQPLVTPRSGEPIPPLPLLAHINSRSSWSSQHRSPRRSPSLGRLSSRSLGPSRRR